MSLGCNSVRIAQGGKNGQKKFVQRMFTIFATNVSFLRIFANLQI